jgi:hypothetical protein
MVDGIQSQQINPTCFDVCRDTASNTTGPVVSRAECGEILRRAYKREKILKNAAKGRTAELRADFEAELAAAYRFDYSHVW